MIVEDQREALRRWLEGHPPGPALNDALTFAVRVGAVDLARELMDRGARADFTEETDGDTLLHTAVRGRAGALVAPLLAHGAAVNKQNKLGRTALMDAVDFCHEAVEPLLAHGASVALRDREGRTVLQQQAGPEMRARLQRAAVGVVIPPAPRPRETLNAELLGGVVRAAAGGDPVAGVKALLDEGADPRVRNAESWPVLVLAANRGQTAVVRLLLDRGAEIDAAVSEWGWNALLQAAVNGHADTVDLLLARGARPTFTNRFNKTAATLAAERGHDALAARLLAAETGGKPPVLAGTQNSPPKADANASLAQAAQAGDAARVRRLLAQGANPDAVDGEKGWSALIFAADGGHAPVVQALLAAGANANAQTRLGCPALSIAAGAGHLPVVEMLLAGGAKADPACSFDAAGPMEAAIISGRLPVIERLLQAIGGDLKTARTPSRGDSYLMVAAKSSTPPIVRYFLGKGVDPNARGPEGHTALIYTAFQGKEENARLLLAAGADPTLTATGEPGAPRYNALRVAQEQGYPAMVKLLKADMERAKAPTDALCLAILTKSYERVSAMLAQGVSPNGTDTDGMAPLHLAVRVSNPGIVRLLLRAGADVTVRDNFNRTALKEALDNERTEIDRDLRDGRLTAGAAAQRHTDTRAIIELLQQAGTRD